MDFSSRNPATSNALNLAARNNDVSNVERLLQKINPNCVDNRGWTCLHEAAYNDNYDCVLLILKNSRCRPLAETHEGHTALYLACRNNCSLKTVTALLNSADDIANYGSTEGVTPLHIASSQGSVKLIELLLDYGAIIDVQDFDGDTPLHDAVLATQHEALVTLLYAGASPEIKNEPGCYTPFHLACCRGYYPNVESLFPFITDINQVTSSGDSPLTLALQGFNDDIVYFLLQNGADPHIKNHCGDMAIDIALRIDFSAKVFQTLLSVTDKDKLNRNIISNACKPHYFKFEFLEILLNSDLGPEFFCCFDKFMIELDGDNLKPSYRTNAPLNSYLNICGYIYKKSPEKFREFFYLFLMRGVDVDAVDVSVRPPLVYAHYVNTSCFNEVFEILMEHDCNVDYCSLPVEWMNDVCFPDAFLASLAMYPPSAPIMMPYSLQCEPEDFLNFAYEKGLLGVISPQVQTELLTMVDSNFSNISAESLQYYVPCLTHLCRSKIRSILRGKKGRVKSTKEFLSILDSLPVPRIIKNYLRYIGK